jgi:hypothetical protein
LAYYVDLILITHDQTVSGRSIKLFPLQAEQRKPVSRCYTGCNAARLPEATPTKYHGIVEMVSGVRRGNAVQIYLEWVAEVSGAMLG